MFMHLLEFTYFNYLSSVTFEINESYDMLVMSLYFYMFALMKMMIKKIEIQSLLSNWV